MDNSSLFDIRYVNDVIEIDFIVNKACFHWFRTISTDRVLNDN